MEGLLGTLFILLMIIIIYYALGTNATFQNISLYVPEATMFILLGISVGLTLKMAFPDQLEAFKYNPEIFFNVLLPPIIFWAGWEANKSHFFRNFGSILMFAISGTIVTAVIIGVMNYVCGLGSAMYGQDFITSMSLGSLISAIDLVSTISIFNKLGVNPCLYNIVFGESVINDAVSIVIFSIFDEMDPSLSAGSILAGALWKFCVMTGASTFLGVLSAMASALLFKKTTLWKQPQLEFAAFGLIAYLSYIVAEALHLSGIMCIMMNVTSAGSCSSLNPLFECRAS